MKKSDYSQPFSAQKKAIFANMTDKRLEVFCTLAEQLSFSRTAKLTGISQPAVTKHIANLEKEVGTALFLRLGTSVILTPKGEEFYGTAKKIVELYKTLELVKG